MLYDKEAEIKHGAQVREMFGRIAGHYDLLNHLLSINIDKSWRRRVVEKLSGSLSEKALVLDVACGTGDLSLALSSGSKARIVATDFCRPMLDLAAGKSRAAAADIRLIEGDALHLPFRDKAFDAATIAFGLRNLANIEAGLLELRRILRPGGELVILEFSRPTLPGFNSLFKFYFTRVLPRLGGIVSRSQAAYEYLPNSVARFPDQESLATLLRRGGFEGVYYDNLTLGVAALHYGKRTGINGAL